MLAIDWQTNLDQTTEQVHQAGRAWAGVAFIFFVLFAWGLFHEVSKPFKKPPKSVKRQLAMWALVILMFIAAGTALGDPEPERVYLWDAVAIGVLVWYNRSLPKNKGESSKRTSKKSSKKSLKGSFKKKKKK